MLIETLSDTQKEYTLQLFEALLPKEVDTEVLKFIDDGLIIYNTSKPPIHWYQLVTFHIPQVLFKNSVYWESRFACHCLEPLTKRYHPVDYLYQKYNDLKNTISWYTPTKNELQTKIESKLAKQEEKEQKRKEIDKNKKEKQDKKNKSENKMSIEDTFFE